jgi:hypothetical protein
MQDYASHFFTFHFFHLACHFIHFAANMKQPTATSKSARQLSHNVLQNEDVLTILQSRHNCNLADRQVLHHNKIDLARRLRRAKRRLLLEYVDRSTPLHNMQLSQSISSLSNDGGILDANRTVNIDFVIDETR